MQSKNRRAVGHLSNPFSDFSSDTLDKSTIALARATFCSVLRPEMLESGLPCRICRLSDFLAGEDFVGAFNELAKLRGPIDSFFEQVMVNADDSRIRENRLSLLSQFLGSVDSIVRLSSLEG